MYRSILIPTDGSHAADSAVGQAYEIAERFGATVHVLYVIDVDQTNPFELSADRLIEAYEEEGKTVTTETADRAPDGIDVVTAIEDGAAHERILEYADDHEIDLIVMGTHGRRGLDRVILGSVTERVLRQAPGSVLVTRPSSEADVTVATAEQAIDRAREVVADDGHDDVSVLDDPYEQGRYWIVRTEGDGVRFNVHIDRSSGETRIARLER
ncbi:universal stress protein [Natronosalvus vescus]|uniref:universal stress protein n=1 Tax=Natronosalvus vescus TaxID=2953881 RepID=UPI0020900EDF|nr:universal stress protein [Natronosalvus vescus]